MNEAVDFIDEPFDADLAAVEKVSSPIGAVVTGGADGTDVMAPTTYILDARVNRSYSLAAEIWDEGLMLSLIHI